MTNPYIQFCWQVNRTDTSYLKMFYGLLPKGFIWVGRKILLGRIIQDVIEHQTEWQDTAGSTTVYQDVIRIAGEGDVLLRLLSCFGSELLRLEKFAIDLLNQTDPGVSTSLLADWERVLGLPGECFASEELSIEERQTLAHIKLFSTNQTPTMVWWIQLASDLGFEITITENAGSTNPRIYGAADCVYGDASGVPPYGGRGGWADMDIHIVSGTGNEKVLKCIFYLMKPAHCVITKDGSTWNP